jgi:glycosyltransferase involved in cell wall biosynthesis
MTTPVSIIIPCYNQGAFLREAIESCLSQRHPSLEIVVVDDGSTDNTAEVARSFGGAITLTQQSNRGLAAARNAGIRASRGQYVALLDSDDVCLPDRIQLQAGYLDEHPSIGLVASDAWLYDGTQRLALRSTISGSPKNPRNFRWETRDFCMTPSTAMFRRACFEQTAQFNEQLRRAAEDWLFAVQLAVDHDLAYLSTPTILYRVHANNATKNRELVNSENRIAADAIVSWPRFRDYPPSFRSKLLIYRSATCWRHEPKHRALSFLLRGLLTDPTQIRHVLKVVRQSGGARLASTQTT